MSISPVSNVQAVHGATGTAHSPETHQTPKSSSGSQQPADSVHLSPAAKAHLAGADTDGDGDGK